MQRQVGLSLLGAALLLPVTFLGADVDFGAPPRNRYIGAKACKNCHNTKEKGEAFQKWEAGPHAKAWKTLAGAKAKKIAAELGIKDPQKSPKCLKCHVTAHGLKKRQIKRGFRKQLGVQCESCHGPGEKHFKKRFAEASAGDVDLTKFQQVAKGEIIVAPDAKTCEKCHNKESPTYMPFCFQQRRAALLHLDPRKKRTPEDIKALETLHADDKCEVCKKVKADKAKAGKAAGSDKKQE